MKQIFYTALAALSFCCHISSAQQFMNGSFEPKVPLTPCMEISSSSFNTQMGNVWAYSGPGKVYLSNGACGKGMAVTGNHFIGAEYESLTGGITIVMKLDTFMTPGKQYKFTFDYKKDASIGPATIFTGYNTGSDSMGHDSLVHIFPIPGSTGWTTITDSLTPGVASRYIYIRAGTMGSAPLVTYLDNFRMLDVPNTAIPEPGINKLVTIAPNPVSTTATIHLDDYVSLPCNMYVQDIHGRLLLQQQVNERNFSFLRNDLPPGLYLLKLSNATGHVYNTKLVIE